MKTIVGKLQAKDLKFALVASRFNDLIVNRLIDGAVDFLTRHGANEDDLTLVRVPGAFELPKAAKKLATSNQYDGIVCLGALIRGETPHFDYIAAEATKGLAQVNLNSDTPIGFGVLTTDTTEQAMERAGIKSGNKGAEAASACLEMVQVLKML